MNQHLIRSIAIACAIAAAGNLQVQTCIAPVTLEPNTTVYGSTCGNQKVADVFCDGTPNPGPNAVGMGPGADDADLAGVAARNADRGGAVRATGTTPLS